MALLAAVREFDSGVGAVASTFDIDFGFTPILLFFAGAGIDAADSIPIAKRADGKQSFGMAADDLTQAVLAGAVQDAAGTQNSQRHLSNIASFLRHANGSGTVLGSLKVNSILATGVRMEVVVQFSTSRKGIVLALGDDGVPSALLSAATVIDAATSSGSPFDITGFGFDPEHVMSLGRVGTGALPASGAAIANCIGTAKSGTLQAYLSQFESDGLATMDNSTSSRDTDQAHVRPAGSAINQRLNFNALITDGIRYNQDEGVLADRLAFGGWRIGGFSTVADSLTETDLVTLFSFTTGFRAQAGIFFSPHFTENALDTVGPHDRWMIGFFARQPDGTIEEMCVALFSDDNVGTSIVKIAQRDASMYVGLTAGAGAGPESHASISEVQATAVECIMTDADPAARFIYGVFFGPGNFPTPTLDTAIATGPNQIDLGWTNNEPSAVDPDFWAIERESPMGGGFSEIDTVVGSATTYNDTTVLPSTQYCYRIVGRVTGEGDSPPSNELCATTPAPPGPGAGAWLTDITSTPDIADIA